MRRKRTLKDIFPTLPTRLWNTALVNRLIVPLGGNGVSWVIRLAIGGGQEKGLFFAERLLVGPTGLRGVTVGEPAARLKRVDGHIVNILSIRA